MVASSRDLFLPLLDRLIDFRQVVVFIEESSLTPVRLELLYFAL